MSYCESFEAPIVELTQPMAAYLLWLVSSDLGKWNESRRTRLTRDEAISLAMFLADHLPSEMRSPVPAAPPVLMAS